MDGPQGDEIEARLEKRRTLGYKVIWSTLTSLVAPTNFWALKTSLGLNLTFLTITTHGVNYFLKEHSYSKLFCQQGNIWPKSYRFGWTKYKNIGTFEQIVGQKRPSGNC